MPVYHYIGINQTGKRVKGSQDADSPKQIKAALRRDGIFLTELTEATPQKQLPWLQFLDFAQRWRNRVSTQDMAMVTRQLATLINAGIPLVDSLVALIEQIENPFFKSVWADVKQKVNEGISFAEALAAHPTMFNPLYVNMVRAGEQSGTLDVVLLRLADFTESQANLQAKVTGSLMYPAVVMTMVVAVMLLLFVFVIPKLQDLFASQKATLPLPTIIVIGISDFVCNYWYLLIVGIIASITLFRRFIRSPYGEMRWHRFVLNVPIFGPLLRMVAITRFCKTLATLIASGVPLLGAFDIVKNVVQNRVLLDVIEVTKVAVQEGDNIAGSLKRSGEFPPIVTHMIAIGERSGQLEQMLQNIANAYDVQIDARIRAMTSLLEPMMMVVMGVVVGFIIMSVLLPMLQLSALV